MKGEFEQKRDQKLSYAVINFKNCNIMTNIV